MKWSIDLSGGVARDDHKKKANKVMELSRVEVVSILLLVVRIFEVHFNVNRCRRQEDILPTQILTAYGHYQRLSHGGST